MDYIEGMALMGFAGGAAYLANYLINKKEKLKNLEISVGLCELKNKENMLDLIKGFVDEERGLPSKLLETFDLNLLNEILDEHPEYKMVIDELKARYRAHLDKGKSSIENPKISGYLE